MNFFAKILIADDFDALLRKHRYLICVKNCFPSLILSIRDFGLVTYRSCLSLRQQNKNIRHLKNYRISLNEKTFFYISLILTIFVRLRFADAPFERDEGEYAYAGMMILRGQLPYVDFYNMKLPGVYCLYALVFKLFGQSVAVIRYFLLFVNLITTFFVFKTAQNWLSRTAAWWASGLFMLLSFSFHAQGWIANCEQFVNLFVAASLFFLTKRWNPAHLFLCGLMLGFATLMKQHAFHFAFFPAYLLLKQFLEERKFINSFIASMAFGLGFALPLLATMFFFWQKGIFDAFYFYIIQYATAYSTLHAQIFDNINSFAYIMVDNAVMWLALLATVFIAIKQRFSNNKETKTLDSGYFMGIKSENTEGVNLCILVGIALIAVCPGWYLRLHYFQYLFVPAALLMSFSLIHYERLFGVFAKKLKLTWFVGLSLLVTFAVQIEYIVLKSPDYVTSIMYRWGYFTEIREIGNYINSQAKENEYIGQLTHEPELWFYTQTQAATGFLYAYPLIENHEYAPQLVEQYIKETESHHPDWFVYSDIRKDEKNSLTSEKLNVWAREYLKNYELKGILYQKNKFNASFETNFLSVDTSRRVVFEVYKRKSI